MKKILGLFVVLMLCTQVVLAAGESTKGLKIAIINWNYTGLTVFGLETADGVNLSPPLAFRGQYVWTDIKFPDSRKITLYADNGANGANRKNTWLEIVWKPYPGAYAIGKTMGNNSAMCWRGFHIHGDYTDDSYAYVPAGFLRSNAFAWLCSRNGMVIALGDMSNQNADQVRQFSAPLRDSNQRAIFLIYDPNLNELNNVYPNPPELEDY